MNLTTTHHCPFPNPYASGGDEDEHSFFSVRHPFTSGEGAMRWYPTTLLIPGNLSNLTKMKKDDSFPPIARSLNVLLADDDKDDCMLFRKALEELPIAVNLTTVYDGLQLMDFLLEPETKLPDVLFLDLNMPRQNGYVSLGLIKRDSQLLRLPVIIFSTVFEETKLSQVFRDAAHFYIRKPNEFGELKKVIYKALTLIAQENTVVPGKEDFVLKV
jgi:CheY-like chemotaxis protein